MLERRGRGVVCEDHRVLRRGSVGVDLPGGTGPRVVSALALLNLPGRVVFEYVMSTAEMAEIIHAGFAAEGGVMVVVDVAGLGRVGRSP